MRHLFRYALLAATLAAVAPTTRSVEAQARPDRPSMDRGARAMGPEAILRMRERLQLTEDQVQRLDVIRQEVVAQRSAAMAERAELRSRMMAGQTDRGALRQEMQERRQEMQGRRDEMQARRDELRGRIESVLNQAQRDSVQQIGARARAFRMGRAAGARAARGGMRDGRRGMRGDRTNMRNGRQGLRGDGARPRAGRPQPPEAFLARRNARRSPTS